MGRQQTVPRRLSIAFSLVRIFGSGFNRMFSFRVVFCQSNSKSTILYAEYSDKIIMRFSIMQEPLCVFSLVKISFIVYTLLFNPLNCKKFFEIHAEEDF